MQTFGVILLVLFIFLLIALALWIAYVHIRAKRLGLPSPTLSSYIPFSTPRNYRSAPRSGGLIGFFQDKVREWKYKRNRSAAGSYEGTTLNSRPGGRGRGLDPDDAWDTRVGNEAELGYGPEGGYYEEELGLNRTTSYHGASKTNRGRQLRREEEGTFVGGNQSGLDARYNSEMGISAHDGTSGGDVGGVGQGKGLKVDTRDPFGDDNAASMRSLSPAPASGRPGQGHKRAQSSLSARSADGDERSERRSVFRENM